MYESPAADVFIGESVDAAECQRVIALRQRDRYRIECRRAESDNAIANANASRDLNAAECKQDGAWACRRVVKEACARQRIAGCVPSTVVARAVVA